MIRNWKELREKALELREKGYSYREIGEMLKISKASAWYLIHLPQFLKEKPKRMREMVEKAKRVEEMKRKKREMKEKERLRKMMEKWEAMRKLDKITQRIERERREELKRLEIITHLLKGFGEEERKRRFNKVLRELLWFKFMWEIEEDPKWKEMLYKVLRSKQLELLLCMYKILMYQIRE